MLATLIRIRIADFEWKLTSLNMDKKGIVLSSPRHARHSLSVGEGGHMQGESSKMYCMPGIRWQRCPGPAIAAPAQWPHPAAPSPPPAAVTRPFQPLSQHAAHLQAPLTINTC